MKKSNRSLGAGLWVVMTGLLVSSNVLAQSNVCVIAPKGMISSWRGESNALDSVGVFHGEVGGDVTYGAGVVGEAFHFGGFNGKVIVSNATNLNFGPNQDFSIEAWIAPQVASTSFGVMDIVDKRLSPSLTECLGYEFNLGDGRLHCRLSDSLSGNGVSFGPAGPDLRDGYFHHVALTFARNSSTGGRLYVDGQVVLTFDTTGLGDFSNDQPLRIGHSSASSFFNGNFKGIIDEVSIYSRNLTGAEIAAIYQAGSAGKCDPSGNPSCIPAPFGAIGWWKGDGSVADYAGANAGVMMNGGSYSGAKVDGGFQFDGTNQCVQIPYSLALITSNFTVEGWIRPDAQVSDAINQEVIFGQSFGALQMVVRKGNSGLLVAWQFGTDHFNFYGVQSTVEIPIGQFTHVAGTWDGMTLRLFINGVLNAQNSPGASPVDSGCDFSIGGFYNPSANNCQYVGQFFKGVVDEMTLYSRALTAGEIVSIVDVGNAGKCADEPPITCVTAPAGLVSVWKGEANASDSAGSNHGGILGNVSYGLGRVGQAFVFEGTNGAVTIPQASSLNVQSLTIEGWINPTDVSSQAPIAEFAAAAGWSGVHLWISVPLGGGAGTLFGNVRSLSSGLDQNIISSAPGLIQPNQWSHVAITYDQASGIARLYLNATNVATKNLGSIVPNTGLPLNIGWRPDSGPEGGAGLSFSGRIDELSLYNRALSGSEIGSIVLAGSGGKCPPQNTCLPSPANLIGWWKGEENGLDSRGLNHGTLIGGIVFTQAVVGAGFSFDGINDGVVIPNSSALNFDANAEFTIEAWIRPLPSTTDFGVMTIVDKRLSPNLTQCLGYEFNLGDGRIHCRLSDSLAGNGLAVGPAGPDLRDGQYHHVALTLARNSVSGGRLYVDGAAVAVFDTTGLGDFSNTEPLRIGNHSASFFNGYFKGEIDEVSVYNRALTPGEVATIFGSGIYGKCAVPEVPFLINVDYGAGTNGTTKEGFAALGSTTNDFWNFYTRDGVGGVMRTFGALSNLSLVDGTATFVGMTVANGPGMCGNGSTDPMYFSYIYPFDSGNLIVTFTNLPPGRYDVLPYCFDGNYEVTVGGTSYGIRTTRDYPVVNPPVWTEGLQFARFTNVVVQSGQPLILTVRPGIDGYAVLSGIQLLRTSTNPPAAPFITQQPASRTLWVGTNVAFSVTAGGDAPLFYQWLYNGTNLPGKTSSTLSLMNVQLSDSGQYSVIITNFAGAITSQIAVLTVKLPPSCSPPASGLVSHWRFENNILDTWGENHGIFSGRGAPFDTGKSGRALWATTPLIVLDDPSLDLTNAFTLEAWVRPSTLSITTPQTILAKFENITAVPLGMQSSFYLGLTNNGSPFLVVSGSGSVRTNVNLVAPIRIPANAWTHLGATYDGASLRLYTNGVLVASNSYSGGVFASSTDLTIGGLTGGLSRSFNGLLDEVAIYNRALNQAEILAAYESDFAGKCVVGPEITANPLSQAIPEGEDVRLTVSAAGTKPFRYQWRFNETNIASATNAALVIEKAAPGHAGFYSVAVSNSAGSDLSASAQLKLLPAPSCVGAPEGLISWWPMDGNPMDVVGLSMSIASGVSYPTGKVGRALAITFSGGRVWVPQPASSLNFGTNQSFSIEVWVKASSSSNPSAMPFMMIVEKRSSPFNGTGYMMGLWNGRLAFALGSTVVSPTNSSLVRAAGPDLRDDMFHHLAVTVQRGATNGGTLFVDGEVVATFDTSIPRNGSSSGSFYIGAPGQVFLDASPLFGMIDEMAIYNRALSAAEVESIAAAGAVGKCKLPPTIITQPMDQTVKVSSNAVFTVLASGTPTLRYWWWKGSQPLPVSTNSTLTLSNVQLSAAGAYRVVVTNGFGAVTSSIANLLVQQLVPPVNGGQMRLEAADGHPVIRFSGVPGQQYTIQASTNLVDWVNVGVASDLGDGIFEFTDPDVRSRDALFYRVVGP